MQSSINHNIDCDQQAGRPCDQQAGRPCDQQAGRPHCAGRRGGDSDLSVQTPRTQLGGDGDSLEEKVEQAAPPNITQRHVQGDAPQPPKQSRFSYPGASQRPTPDCSAAEHPYVGAPASSSPPAHLSSSFKKRGNERNGKRGRGRRRSALSRTGI